MGGGYIMSAKRTPWNTGKHNRVRAAAGLLSLPGNVLLLWWCVRRPVPFSIVRPACEKLPISLSEGTILPPFLHRMAALWGLLVLEFRAGGL